MTINLFPLKETHLFSSLLLLLLFLYACELVWVTCGTCVCMECVEYHFLQYTEFSSTSMSSSLIHPNVNQRFTVYATPTHLP